MGRLQRKNTISQTHAEYRLSQVWITIKSIIYCLNQCVLFLWQHNPVKILAERQRRLYFVENYGGLMIKPRLKERVLDLFLTDFRRRKRLLRWVQARLHTSEIHDFSTCWHDGTILCALLESVCPGVCPSYHLLSPLNMVKNCRLGIKLANKYLYVPMDLLTPEEMAIATVDTEFKIIQYVSMIKWASQNIREKWTILHESLIAAKTGKCFAKGSGLRNGIVGKRSKFTIVVSDTIGVFNLLVEVRGPNNDFSGERIVSLHQAKGVLDKISEGSRTLSDSVKYLEDCVGNTFVRKKVPSRFAADNQNDLLVLDFQCGEEGTFYVTFVPRRAGIHAVSVKWQNHHVENSPFRIKVYKASNVSTKSLKGAQEKRVIFDSLSMSTLPGAMEENFDLMNSRNQMQTYEPGASPVNAISKAKAYSKGRQLTVTSRRVLRRIITRNGEDIVIEEAVSPTLSRQSSVTDNSDDDRRIITNNGEDIEIREAVSPTLSRQSSVTDNSDDDRRIITRNGEDIVTEEAVSPTLSRQSSVTDNSDDDRYSKRDEKGHSPKSHVLPITENTVSSKSITSLGTVLEEKQNSRENLFKDINLSDIVSSTAFKQKLEEFTTKSKHQESREIKQDVALNKAGERENRIPEEETEVDVLEPRDHQYQQEPEVTVIQSRGDPSIKYTCTELNEHNLLESSERKEEQFMNSEERVSSWFMLPEDTEQFVERNVVKRSSLKRTLSIHGYKKTAAHRTTSDGTIYRLRRRIMSMSAGDISDNSSEVSSDDRQSGNDEDSAGAVVPSLKLLHSHSLKKACMYVSQNAYQSFKQSDDVIENSQFPRKQTVRATQSLPITRTNLKDFENTNSTLSDTSVNGEIKTTTSLKKRTTDVIKPTARFQNTTVENRGDNKTGQGVKSSLRRDSDISERRLISRHEQFINQNIYVNILEDESDLSESTSSNQYHKTTLYTDLKSPNQRRENSSRGSRGTLIRQWTVQCHRSSQSSSETGNEISKDGVHKQNGTSCAQFKSIFIQSDVDSDSPVTQEVIIVVPKPKVDKQTQVCHTEITRETGWDLIEGVYILLRRVSVKVPCITTCPPSPASYASSDSRQTHRKSPGRSSSRRSSRSSSSSRRRGSHRKIDRSSCNLSDTNQLHLPCLSDTDRFTDTSSLKASTHEESLKVSEMSNVYADDIVIGRKNDNESNQVSHSTYGLQPEFNTGNVTSAANPGTIAERPDNIEELANASSSRNKHAAVNEWFRRNDNILQRRQGTVETVDSGFDDNLTLFNKHARFSLPTLRTGNGHIKLHRRPYKGRITLEPELVNSSNNSMSGDRKDLGNEADDELFVNSTFDNRQNKTQRRRHKLETREDSFSFSDSEINQNQRRRRRSLGFASRRNKPSSTKANCEEVQYSSPTNANRKQTEAKDETSLADTEKETSNDENNQTSQLCTDLDNALNEQENTQKGTPRKGTPGGTQKIYPKKEVVKKSSTTTSTSIDSNYCGFGVSKSNRSVFLSHIGNFQNLCTTEEVPDDNASSISRPSFKSAMDNANSVYRDYEDIEASDVGSSDGHNEAVDNNDFISVNSSIVEYSHPDSNIDIENVSHYTTDDVVVVCYRNPTENMKETDLSLRTMNSDSLTTVSDIQKQINDNETTSDGRMGNIDEDSSLDQDMGVFNVFETIDDHPRQMFQRLIESQNGYIRNALFVDTEMNDENVSERLSDNAVIHVAGAGLHQSLVGANNSFQVWTENLSAGSLSVNITGPRPHTVTETSVLYTGDNLYEVSYGVTQPGLYRIHVRWGDCDIPNSPFLCSAVFL